MRSLAFCLLTVCLIYLQSCTIEKRHYTSGYHIEKIHHEKNRIKDAPKLAEQNAKEDSDPVIIKVEKTILEESVATTSTEEIQTDSLIQEDISASQEESIPIIQKIKNSPRIQQGVKRITEKKLAQSLATKKKSKKGKIFGRLSAVCGLLAWIIAFVAVGIALGGGEIVTASALAWLALFLALFGFILAIVTFKTTKKSKKPSGRTAAVIGLVLSGLFLIFILIGLIT